ncbi:hypothetical protein PIB30_075559 [Stylosanthes scabra]|uniref:Putative plant transposon protein domain-containing protein n=1 Tax=Stylosanthes scabra TaxID=79078 RepID=A0ABU6WPU4_9FABA|nr:hypothetical protein [Stylosanthes scabra]
MRFKAQVEGARIDFETRNEHDQQLDSVLADLCMPGATWKLSTGQQRVPIQLRRQELNLIPRGWHELSIHSLIPSSNRSEIPVIRAILIHCIMNGEDVRAEEIIADKMVTKQIYDNTNNNRPMLYGLLKSDLPPSGTAPPPPKSKDPRDAPN